MTPVENETEPGTTKALMVTIHQLDLMSLEFFSNLNGSQILKIRKRAVRCDRNQLSKQNGEKLLRHQ